MDTERTIAYFSMEVGLESKIPTYSGGLGVLAGDTIRAAADLKVPMVAVTLLHRKGYFDQLLGQDGWQTESPVDWPVNDYLEQVTPHVTVTVEQRSVRLRAWTLELFGATGYSVPVYFLDSDLEGNADVDRRLTNYLYGGDVAYRLGQEIVLGFGGVRMLRALGYDKIDRFHMNEGHAALLTLELLREERERAGRSTITQEDVETVHEKCVFTTHTPVPAGHDQFDLDLVDRVLGNREACGLHDPICHEGRLNMTFLALSLSRYVNGVAKRHGELSRHMFAGYKIDAVTNGVHAATWTSPAFTELFDQYIPGWREDSFSLRYAMGIPRERLWNAHQRAKKRLVEYANRRANPGLDVDVLTLGFARRMTAYKRPELLFSDVERLRRLQDSVGALQLVFSGKAHARDHEGKEIIKRVHHFRDILGGQIRVVYLPNYDMDIAKLVTSGVDLWLNTPHAPLEASGTSGMKAALNGVPSLSVLDGWWVEGCIEGVTGWSFGEKVDSVQGAVLFLTTFCTFPAKLRHVVRNGTSLPPSGSRSEGTVPRRRATHLHPASTHSGLAATQDPSSGHCGNRSASRQLHRCTDRRQIERRWTSFWRRAFLRPSYGTATPDGLRAQAPL